MEWSGYKWRSGQPWGNFHPNNLKSWYDPTAFSVDEEGVLNMTVHENPKEFDVDGKKVIIPNGVGLICSDETDFGYGYYEAECLMPSGPALWPAFWLSAVDSWPPEIDIVEAYSGKKGNYWGDFLNWRKIETNLHYGVQVDGKHPSTGAESPCFFRKRPNKKYIKYFMLWTEDEIMIKYDERIVTHITDPEILKWYKGKKMNVIFNVSLQEDIFKGVDIKSPFKIKNFKYEKLGEE